MKIKILLLVSALLLLFACTQKEPQKTTLVGMYSPYYYSPETYKGQLKELTVMVHFAQERGEIVYPGDLLTDAEIDSLGLTGHTKTTFDPNGNVTSSTYLKSDGTIYYIFEIDYKDGMYVESKYSDSEKVIRRDIVKKYENGIPVEIEMDNLVNGNRFSMQVNYNSIGQYLSLNQVDSLGNPVISRNYTWGENMHLMEYTLTNREGKVTRVSKFNYLPDGNTVEREMYNGADSLLWKSLAKDIEWDNMGNPTGTIYYRNGELMYYDIIAYVYY